MRKSNIEVIKDFAKGINAQSHTGNLYTIGAYLYNYRTIIAQRTNEGVILNNHKYSSTTSKIQTYIRRYTNVIEEKDEIQNGY